MCPPPGRLTGPASTRHALLSGASLSRPVRTRTRAIKTMVVQMVPMCIHGSPSSGSGWRGVTWTIFWLQFYRRLAVGGRARPRPQTARTKSALPFRAAICIFGRPPAVAEWVINGHTWPKFGRNLMKALLEPRCVWLGRLGDRLDCAEEALPSSPLLSPGHL